MTWIQWLGLLAMIAHILVGFGMVIGKPRKVSGVRYVTFCILAMLFWLPLTFVFGCVELGKWLAVQAEIDDA